jgi:GNAT superfamily N-acetyltransferase
MNGTPDIVVKRIGKDDDALQAYCCMTEVPTPWPKALCECRDWVAENLGKHVDGYHLQLVAGEVIGHLYYTLSEHALFSYDVEPGAAILYCEWVQQRYQKRGFGTRLFETFLTALKKENAKGVLVEATDLQGQMYYGHYISRGFKIVHETGHHKLMYLPLSTEQVGYHRRKPRIQPRSGLPVEIHLFRGFLCPYEVSTQLLVRNVAQEFGDQVVIREVWLTPETLDQYGVPSGVLINGMQKLAGGETERAVRQAIIEEL